MKDLEIVFETSDLVEQNWVESLLEEAGIAFSVADEQVQHLVGYGQLGGRNLVVGGVKLLVAGEDAARARELLVEASQERSADSGERPEGVDEEGSVAATPSAPDEAAARVRRWSRASVVCAVIWAGGIGSLLAVYFGLRALGALRGEPEARRTQPIVGTVLGVLGLLLWFQVWGLVFFG